MIPHRRFRWAWWLLPVLLVWGCDPTGPRRGSLTVALEPAGWTGSVPSALYLAIRGPGVRDLRLEGAEFEAYVREVGPDEQRILILGSVDRPGVIARFTASEPDRPAAYTATVEEVVDADYRLLDPTAFSVRVSKEDP